MTNDTHAQLQKEDQLEHPTEKPVKAKLHPIASESSDDLASLMNPNTSADHSK